MGIARTFLDCLRLRYHDGMSPRRIDRFQSRMLRRAVRHAQRRSEFYRELYRGIDPDDPAFSVEQLPTVSKEALMANFDRLATDPRLKLAEVQQWARDKKRIGQRFLGRYVVTHTSGTTGTSKGVTLTHNAIAWNAVSAIREGLGENPQGVRHLSVLPLAHTYECTLGLVGVLSTGGEIKYLDGPPTASRLMKALGEVKPTMMLTVPLLMEKIYRSKVAGPLKAKPIGKILYAFPPVRKLIHKIAGKKILELFGGNIVFYGIGGAPLPKDVEQFLVEGKFPYSVGYGLTETAPLLAGGYPADMKFRSTGNVLPGVSLRIADPDTGTGIGEIQAKGPSIMNGYWKDDEKTAEVFTEDGWFRTGDLGSLDGEILYIKGRLKDVLLGSNGENIYPDEVESVINGHNYVSESLAYIKDGQLVARILLDTEKITAEIKHLRLVGAEKVSAWKNELMNHIRRETNKHLGRNSKIQSFIEQIKPFEKTPSLKIKRFLYTVKKK